MCSGCLHAYLARYHSLISREDKLAEKVSGALLRTATIICITLILLLALPLSAKSKSKPRRSTNFAPDAAYVAALSAANHFLRAWQTGDLETGIMLLTDSARRECTEDRMRAYFAAPFPRSFEVHRGYRLHTGRYSFPIVLLEATQDQHARRRYSEIVVVTTGMSDYAIDKLP